MVLVASGVAALVTYAVVLLLLHAADVGIHDQTPPSDRRPRDRC